MIASSGSANDPRGPALSDSGFVFQAGHASSILLLLYDRLLSLRDLGI